MSLERPSHHPGGISAQQRLAQTREEIAALILPMPAAPAAAAQQAAMRRAAAARRQAEAASSMQSAAAMRRADVPADSVEFVHEPGMPFHPGPASATAAGHAGAAYAAAPPAFAWTPMLRRGVSIWWRHHPAHAAFEVADSMLSHVARRKPYQMLAVAAGAGALFMLIRPWRLVSITGLAFAALKMTDVRSMFGSLRGD